MFMFMFMILVTSLSSTTTCSIDPLPSGFTVDTEKHEITTYLNDIGLRPDRKLKVLAHWQTYSMAYQEEVNEMDINFRDFSQRLKIFGLDQRRNRFDEYYFRCYYVFYENFKGALAQIKDGGYTHYGLDVCYNNGFYYITITLADYREYA